MSGLIPYFSALKSRRLHLGVCGSVAAYKAAELVRGLQKAGIQVSVTLTASAQRFITPLTFASLGAEPVYSDLFGHDDGTEFAHLLPGQTAHAMLIAPATATTLARLACGLADDMLSAQALAFPGPLLVAPAMNPHMWSNPATQQNIRTLEERGVLVVRPSSGRVACGDTGEGKLAPLEAIAFAAARALAPQDMKGKKVMLTLGPTREQWDGVRVWTNLSTGRMGAALACAAYLRGADVHAVAGPGVPALPAGIRRYDVAGAREMYTAAERHFNGADIGIFTAAVADFYPEPFGAAKFKKQGKEDGFSVRFLPNPDILATLAATAAPHQKILGFAAETDNMEENARAKRERKKAHLLAGNRIGCDDSGFAANTNRMFVCDGNGREEHWPIMSKADVAWRLLDWLSTL